MSAKKQDVIEIYHDGALVSFEAREELSIELQKNFLNNLTGLVDGTALEKSGFYILTKTQLDEFIQFRLGKSRSKS